MLRCPSAPTEGGEGRGHIVAATHQQLVIITKSIELLGCTVVSPADRHAAD